MRIQLIICSFLFSLSTFGSAAETLEMKELFRKYDLVMEAHQVELIDEVFTKKFLKESGGKEEFVEKIKELPIQKPNKLKSPGISWRKGLKDEIYFASVKPEASEKSKLKREDSSGSQFVIVKEDGKLKIDGTISDAN